MTVTLVFGDTADGQIQSANASYATARTGSGLAANSASGTMAYGQQLSGGTYTLWQAFLRFSYAAIPATERLVTAMIEVVHSSLTGTGTSRELEFWSLTWSGGGLTTADWQTAYAGNLLGRVTAVNGAGTKYVYAGSANLEAAVTAGTSIECFAVTNRQRLGTTPSGQEGGVLYSADASGSANDPLLIFTTVPRSTLTGTIAAQVRLSDGAWAVIENASGTTPRLAWVSTAGVATTIQNLPVGTSSTDFSASAAGAQAFALCVDDADNLYVLGRAGDQPNMLTAFAWAKGSGHTWSAPVVAVRSSLPGNDVGINSVAAVWIGAGGGTLYAICGHGAGNGSPTGTGDQSWAVMKSSYVLTGSGSAGLSTGATTGSIIPALSSASIYNAWANETGSMVDIAVPDGNTNTLFTATVGRDTVLSDGSMVQQGRVHLTNTDPPVIDADDYGASNAYGVKDASAKVRLVPINGTTYAVVTADDGAGYGITIRVWQTTGPGVWSYQGGAFLDAEGLTSMPSAAVIGHSLAWDVVFNQTANRIYIYYVDVANARRVMRTGFSLDSMLATKEEIQVVTNVGSVGTTITALRADAHDPVTSSGLLTIAHANGTTYSTTYTVDSFNLAPDAPTLTPRANFDATGAVTFSWTFSDPNVGDTQAAYSFQVVDVSDSSLDVDTGWVVSTTSSRNVTGGTLANGKSYQWRVRTRDAGALEGPWSAYSTFSTSAGGAVTVTVPSVDNPPGVITDDYTVEWSVTGTVQAAYRVVVTRVDTGATLVNTGWVTSTATSYGVAGMLSAVEYNVAVTVRNGSAVESGTGNRRITPNYGSPEVPIVSVAAVPEGGYVQISVDNPLPTGDRPDVSSNEIYRRATGGSTWTLVGTAPPDGTFRDYTASARCSWEYRVRGVV